MPQAAPWQSGSSASQHCTANLQAAPLLNTATICIRKKGKAMRIMSLPPTDLNLFLHVKRAHLHMLLRKAADKMGPPDVSISEYGWELACKEANCRCHRVKLSCIINCLCTAGDACRNSINKKEDETEGEEQPNRSLSRRLDRCDRMIQNESRDPNGGNVYYVPHAQIPECGT